MSKSQYIFVHIKQIYFSKMRNQHILILKKQDFQDIGQKYQGWLHGPLSIALKIPYGFYLLYIFGSAFWMEWKHIDNVGVELQALFVFLAALNLKDDSGADF